MTQKLIGNTRGLAPSQLRLAEKLYRRKLDNDELVSLDLAREIYTVAQTIGRRVGLIVTRDGDIEMVVLGSREILYLPDLGRYRLGRARLRRLRVIFSDLSKSEDTATIPQDIYTDLEKLRLDAVVAVKAVRNNVIASYAVPLAAKGEEGRAVHTERVPDLSRLELDFTQLMESVEEDLLTIASRSVRVGSGLPAVLVGVYPKGYGRSKESLEELRELARSAGVEILDQVIQFRVSDPRTLIGKGKLEELVLHCLRLGAEMVIFDTELRPAQWRTIVNLTELKVIDRSMLILDIFAQRASSSEGRLQVELAQLKYNLPRLTEQDSGLSRLSGGIGGRGPGETKLEIGRRRARDKIAELERKIERLKAQRGLRRQTQQASGVPVVSLLGYTNVGKSTLFNQLTKATVLVENKLFATLDPARRRVVLGPQVAKNGSSDVKQADSEQNDGDENHQQHHESGTLPLILADTVGFIRELPAELGTAFRTTLEEIGESTLIVHVLDASDPDLLFRRQAVESVLESLGYQEIPRINVFNKIDRLKPDELAQLKSTADGLVISALSRQGFAELIEEVRKQLTHLASVAALRGNGGAHAGEAQSQY